MIALDVGDKIRGEASAATVIDYTLHGIVGSTITQIADGQLAATETDIYTAASIVAVASIILVNTDTSARIINLYLKPSGGTSRRLLPKNLSLPAGYMAVLDGQSFYVYDVNGNYLTVGATGPTGATGATGATGPEGPPGTGITNQAIGWTATGGTDPKTLTVTGNATIASTPAVLGANTFTGTQEMPAVKITTGAGATKVLTSGADGTATWEAAAGGMSAASQAEMETATSNTVGVTPLSAKWHPGTSKAWIKCGIAGNISASHNITSITDDGTGLVTVTIATDFSSESYVIVAGVIIGPLEANRRFIGIIDSPSAGAFQGCSRAYDGTITDPIAWNFSCFGDQ